MTAAESTDLLCPHCDSIMRLVHRLDLKEMPEIYLFHCSRCQHVETLKQERASYAGASAFAAQWRKAVEAEANKSHQSALSAGQSFVNKRLDLYLKHGFGISSSP